VLTYGYKYPTGQKTNKGLFVTRASSTVADLESTYVYDSEGRITSLQYPGGSTSVGYTYDTMGRLSTMTGLSGPGSISATYDLANRLIGLTGNLTETREYNVIGQLTQITSSAYAGGSLNVTYNYSSTQNNGKIVSQVDNISGEQVLYTYDSLNRLASAGATNGSWGQSYTYDGFGNLEDQTVTAGSSTPPLSVVYNAATNRQTTDCADANGNILGPAPAYPQTCANVNPSTQYSYDASNRLHPPSSTGYFYSYAPGNKRVWRGAMDNNGNVTLDEITYWSVSGKKLATYSGGGAGAATSVNAYFGRRLVTNNTGNVVTDRLGSIGKFYPWGQEKPSATTNGTEKFTGYYRDAETQLDYAVNRYHQPGMGRFLTPDPYMASGGPQDPGSWNRYAYVAGDPVNFIDRRGLELECTDDDCDESDDETCSPGYYWSNYDQACEPIQNKHRKHFGSAQVNKSFDIDTQCKKSAAGVIGDVESNFSSFANYTGSFNGFTTTLGFNVPAGGITVGAVIQIPHTTYVAGVAITSYDSATVTQVSATSFTFDTNPGHPLDATITFTAQDMGNGFTGFDISISGATSNALWSLFFAGGGSSFEDGVWNHFLDQVIADCSKKP